MPETQTQIAPSDYIPPPELSAEPANYRISIEDIIYCVDVLKLTHQQTADRLGCAKSNITQRLQRYGYKSGYLKSFKDHEADRYAIRRFRIAKHITDEKLEKMSAYQLVGMDAVTLNSERLIRGQSTENIAYADISKAKSIVDKRIDEFKEKYGISVSNNPEELTGVNT